MSKLFKLSMFLTSFYPLWLSIIIEDIISIYKEKYIKTEIISIISILFMSAIATFIVLKSLKVVESKSPDPGTYYIVSAQKIKGLTSEFLLAYILPFFAFDFTKLDSVILFLVYFLTLAFLCIRNDNIYANILLEIKGYHFYRCSLGENDQQEQEKPIQKTILSKRELDSKLGHLIEIYDWNEILTLDKITQEV